MILKLTTFTGSALGTWLRTRTCLKMFKMNRAGAWVLLGICCKIWKLVWVETNLEKVEEILSSPTFERVDARTCRVLPSWKRKSYSLVSQSKCKSTCFETKQPLLKSISFQVPGRGFEMKSEHKAMSTTIWHEFTTLEAIWPVVCPGDEEQARYLWSQAGQSSISPPSGKNIKFTKTFSEQELW